MKQKGLTLLFHPDRRNVLDDYREMWSKLGLNLENHDALLEVLPVMYRDTFLSQVNRPASMSYFDRFSGEIHGARIRELVELKERGNIVVGGFCTYVPEELVIAAGGALVGLCSGADFAVEEVERELPSNLCALIKSSYGFKLAGVCPYLEVSDLVVGETTCDGKKKYYELLGKQVPMYVMELPQMKGPRDRALWKGEIEAFVQRLEELCEHRITEESLRNAIRTVNAKRRALQRLASLRASDPPVISGRDALLIAQIAFLDDPVRFTSNVNTLCDELEQRAASGETIGTPAHPRIMLSGCPMAIPNWKVPQIVETSGATIVAEEMCTGERYYRDLTDEANGSVAAMLVSIADRYLQIDCAVFTPNAQRCENILNMVRDRKVDGVVYYALKYCDPFTMEAGSVRSELEAAGIPMLYLETDYSQGDTGQVTTRVEAFLEMLRARTS